MPEEHTMATHVETNIHTPKTLRYIRGYPLVGSLPDFTRDRLGLLQRMAREGDVYGMHFGPFTIILFNIPVNVNSFLIDHDYIFVKRMDILNNFCTVIGFSIYCY